jgi:ATP-binding cassette subfamily B multidrug efflux pump
MPSIKWIWTYMRAYKIQYALGFLLVFIVAGLNMLNPYFSGRIIDEVVFGKQPSLLIKFLLIMIGVTLAKTVTRYTYQILFETISQKIIYNIRKRLYEKIQNLDFPFYDRNKTGDVMARLTGDLEAVRHNVAWTIYMVVENIVVFLFAILFMMKIYAPLAVAMLAVTPVIGFFAFHMSKSVLPTFQAIREQFAKLNTVVQENISGNRVVKAFTKEAHEIDKFERENVAFANRNLESARVWEKYLPLLDSLAGVLMVIMIFVGGIFVIRGKMTIGELVTFNSLIWALNNPMRMLGWHLNDIQRFIASASKIADFQKVKPTLLAPRANENDKNEVRTISFRNVDFSYGDEPVLKNIDFEVKAGQRIAIVGPTGSGKSSILHLLNRFYDVTNGEVRINDQNVKSWNLQSLRANIAVAMQDIFLYSDTIEGNIAYGVPHATLEDVVAAAKDADADGFIRKLSEGYDTIIGERGVGLSGGQRQRISLARALLKNAPVLVLDDTTSSVDMETEIRILEALKQRMANKITFIIAHRISSVMEADLILVLAHGEIIERGTHQHLMQLKGHYYNVFQNQFGEFGEGVSSDGTQ